MAQGKTLERTESITIRCTPEEKAEVYESAKRAGLTVTGYLLGVAAGDSLGKVRVAGVKRKQERLLK